MQNGLYKVRFWISEHDGKNVGTGFTLIEDGVMRGGDSLTAHSGTLTLENGEFRGTIRVHRHSHGAETISGLDDATWDLQGRYQPDSARLKGWTAALPGVAMMFTLDRIQV